MTRRWRRAQWLALAQAALLAACAEPITAPTAPTAATPEPTAPAAPAPEPEPTCEDSAIRLVDRGEGIHGAIVDDVLHLGGATAPATCKGQADQSLAAWPTGWTAQVRQKWVYAPRPTEVVSADPADGFLFDFSGFRGEGCVLTTSGTCTSNHTPYRQLGTFDGNEVRFSAVTGPGGAFGDIGRQFTIGVPAHVSEDGVRTACALSNI